MTIADSAMLNGILNQAELSNFIEISFKMNSNLERSSKSSLSFVKFNENKNYKEKSISFVTRLI